MRRLERCSLWRTWLTTCEALQLHPHVHEAMREALEEARGRNQRTKPCRLLTDLDARLKESLTRLKHR